MRSGDKDNKEGQAAQIYWQALFGRGFLRDVEEEGINSFLNYGYAVVRAVCARALCASGLLPLFGVHHHNQFNAFCLADDIMEPFRPFVDCLVYEYVQKMKCLFWIRKQSVFYPQFCRTRFICRKKKALFCLLC